MAVLGALSLMTLASGYALLEPSPQHGPLEQGQTKSIVFNLDRKPRQIPFSNEDRYGSSYYFNIGDYYTHAKEYFKRIILGAPNIDKNIVNDHNFGYYLGLYVGSNRQQFSVHIDTGSHKLILMDSSCTNC